MANFFGAAIGAAMDRERGGSGFKGAIEGTIVEWTIRTVAPIVATYMLGRLVEAGIRRGWQAVSGHDPVDDDGRLSTRSS
jgi:hypothetical protein